MRRAILAIIASLALVVPPLGQRPAVAAIERRTAVPCRADNAECWPTTFAFTPDGKIFYVERFTGQIRIHSPATGSDRAWRTVGGIATSGEQGLLGIALDPRWPRYRWVYVYYTKADPLQNRIVRFRRSRDGSFDAERLTSIPAAGNHNGGVIGFGPDGMLYAVTGDAGDPARAQDTGGKAGKVLRMTKRGRVPSDNPFSGSLAFSYGHRNSFGFAFDPRTGRLWQTENGPECDDEVNLARSGRNYGWGPASDCPGTTESGPDPVPPRVSYTPVIVPTGAAFCQGCRLGSGTGGSLLMGDFRAGAIRRLTLTSDRNDVASQDVIFDNPGGVLGMAADPDGRVYFSDQNGIYRLVRT